MKTTNAGGYQNIRVNSLIGLQQKALCSTGLTHAAPLRIGMENNMVKESFKKEENNLVGECLPTFPFI